MCKNRKVCELDCKQMKEIHVSRYADALHRMLVFDNRRGSLYITLNLLFLFTIEFYDFLLSVRFIMLIFLLKFS